MSDGSVLEAREVSFFYPDGTQALKGVNLSIPRGEITAFLGPNGAGKSTLFLHFNGLLRPASGKLFFCGREVRYHHRALLELRRNVGLVFQDPDVQLFSASVFQEISFGPKNLGLPPEEIRERVYGAMAATGITEVKDRPTHFLSYGQKKRVAIAGVLAMRPQVLICDEPAAGLDGRGAHKLMEMFASFKKDGVTVVFSTHDVDLAYSHADYVVVMAEGKVIGEGVPAGIFADRQVLEQAGLERPWLIEVFEALRSRGLLSGERVPRTKGELLAAIAGDLEKR